MLLSLLLFSCSESFDKPDTGLDAVVSGLVINEFLAVNQASTASPFGDFPPWIELYNGTDADLDLAGYKLSLSLEAGDTTSAAAQAHELTSDLSVPAGRWLLLWADGRTDRGTDHLAFGLSADGELGLFDPLGQPLTRLRFEQQQPDLAAARVTDGGSEWAYLDVGTPGMPNDPSTIVDATLLPAGSAWWYYDAADPGVGWEQSAFDDSPWAIGPAPLGYGDKHIVTTISYGADAKNKPITAFFRARFTVADPTAVTEMTLRLLRDDGAIVYLNGVEVVRDNLPEGAIDNSTLALATAGDADETTYFEHPLDPASLVAGENVVSVGVHQAGATSSDMGFDLEIVARMFQ